MRRVKTISGSEVALFPDTLARILRKHGELLGQEDLILFTVENPDIVLSGHRREILAIRYWPESKMGPKNVVVAYREDKGIIITAFITSKADKIIEKRVVLWRKLTL